MSHSNADMHFFCECACCPPDVDAIMLDFPGSSGSRSSRGGAFRVGGTSMLSPTFLDFLTSEDKPPPAAGSSSSSTAQSHDPSLTSSMLLPSPEYSRRPPPSSSSSLAYARGGRSASPGPVSSQAKSSSAPPQAARGGVRLTPKGFVTPRIWQEFLSDDFKFDAKALSASSEDHTAFDGGDSTISQDMSNVTLLVSSPERRRALKDQVDARHQEDALQMECDEPMFDTAMQDDDEEDKPEHQQFDKRMADAIRKRPRAWDPFPADCDAEIKMVEDEDDIPRSRSSRYSEDRGGR